MNERVRTLKTLIWQEAEWRCSVYSPVSPWAKVSIWILKGTPFSPPCFLGVNSVLMQCTWRCQQRRQECQKWQFGRAEKCKVSARVVKASAIASMHHQEQHEAQPLAQRRACVGYLHKDRSSFLHVPQELCRVELGGMSLWLHNAHWHGDIWTHTNAHFYSRNASKSRNIPNLVQSAGAFINHRKIQLLSRFILPSQSLFTWRARGEQFQRMCVCVALCRECEPINRALIPGWGILVHLLLITTFFSRLSEPNFPRHMSKKHLKGNKSLHFCVFQMTIIATDVLLSSLLLGV